MIHESDKVMTEKIKLLFNDKTFMLNIQDMKGQLNLITYITKCYLYNNPKDQQNLSVYVTRIYHYVLTTSSLQWYPDLIWHIEIMSTALIEGPGAKNM
jgi:hypothetical protein